MKQITLSALTLMLVAAAFAPTAHAQASTRAELGEGTSFVELVRFNRAARNK